MKIKAFILLIIFAYQAKLATAQIQEIKEVSVSTAPIKLLGKTKKVSELISIDATSIEKRNVYRKEKKVPDNFPNRKQGSKAIHLDKEHQGKDQIRQTDYSILSRASIEPKVNIDGLSSSFGSPHDPTGATGLNYYMQAINATQIGIYDKAGELIDTFNANQIWSSVNSTSAGDPILLYDQIENRWIITEFTDPANLLIAVSENEDPLGAYFAFTFSTPNFPDYPKYGLWEDMLYLTTNEGGSSQLHNYFIDKKLLYEGSEEATIQRVQVSGTNGSESGFIVATPATWVGQNTPNGANPLTLMLNDSSWGPADQDGVNLFDFDVNFNDPDSTTVVMTNIPLSNFDAFPCSNTEGGPFACVPQLGGDGLDAIPELVMNAPTYRNFETHESLVFTFITDVTDGENLSGIRWVELRRVAGEEWVVYQEGTFAPDDGLDRFMSSISIDKFGNICLAYNVTSADTYVGIRMTGRRVEDPLGVMTLEETKVIEGSGEIVSGSRFGDYPHMCIDPANDLDFWFTSEYASLNGNSKTRIVALDIARDTIDLGVTALNQPVSAVDLTNAEQVSFTYKNVGVEAVNAYAIGYSIDGVIQEEKMIEEIIEPLEELNFTFDKTADLSEIRSYEIDVFINFPEDQNEFNNLRTTTISNLPNIDVGLQASENQTICSSSTTIEIDVTNFGGDTITDFIIVVMNNSALVEEVMWTGMLENSETATIEYTIESLDEGVNFIELEATLFNGNLEDFNEDDNRASFEIAFLGEEGQAFLNFTTDNYPQESTWEVTLEGDDEILYSGGPYLNGGFLFVEELCLDPMFCYEITIKDSYGDGICCSYGNGGYEIVNNSGNVVYASDGNFGGEETNLFCPAFADCILTAEIDVSDVSEDHLGTIFINASNGVEPYLYSITSGSEFQDTPLFVDLPAGTYEVVVQSSDGCEYTTEVIITTISSLIDNQNDIRITVSPNPSEGFYTLKIENYTSNDFLKFEILNVNGKMVQERKILPYDNIYTTPISLLAYPSGIYYLRIVDKMHNGLVRIVKI